MTIYDFGMQNTLWLKNLQYTQKYLIRNITSKWENTYNRNIKDLKLTFFSLVASTMTLLFSECLLLTIKCNV